MFFYYQISCKIDNGNCYILAVPHIRTTMKMLAQIEKRKIHVTLNLSTIRPEASMFRILFGITTIAPQQVVSTFSTSLFLKKQTSKMGNCTSKRNTYVPVG